MPDTRMSPRLKKFLQNWLINTLGVLIAVWVVPGIRFREDNVWTPFVTALVLGIFNTFLRPILVVLALPLLVFTLGLFLLIINAALLYLASWVLSGHFEIDNFWWALLGSAIISTVSLLLKLLTGMSDARVHFRRHPRAPDSDGPGQGPVIDI